jgi:cyclase
MPDWDNFRYGVQRVSDSVYAYLLPDGSWSLNNTAFVVNGKESLLIDTTVDIPMTRRMITEMAAADPRAKHFDAVVLTHWHIDHVHGICTDELLDSRVIASRACADYMKRLPPDQWKANVAALTGDAKKMMDHLIGTRFDFSGLTYRAPTDIFEHRTEFRVGGLDVLVDEMKPSHTLSDSIVVMRQEGVVHIGDIILPGRHIHLQYPMMQNLIDNCEAFLAMDAAIFIPGHGPIIRKPDIEDHRDYLRFLQTEFRRRYDRGMSSDEAADDLLPNLGPHAALDHPGSLYFTAAMIYSEFAGKTDDSVRKNYTGYLAKQWHLKETLPKKFPQLFAHA